MLLENTFIKGESSADCLPFVFMLKNFAVINSTKIIQVLELSIKFGE